MTCDETERLPPPPGLAELEGITELKDAIACDTALRAFYILNAQTETDA